MEFDINTIFTPGKEGNALDSLNFRFKIQSPNSVPQAGSGTPVFFKYLKGNNEFITFGGIIHGQEPPPETVLVFARPEFFKLIRTP